MPAKTQKRKARTRKWRQLPLRTRIVNQVQIAWFWLKTKLQRGARDGAFRVAIGYVSVDSGLLAICDPAYLSRTPKGVPSLLPLDEGMEPYVAISQRGQQFGGGSWGSAVVVGTGLGDGIFPVYWENGRIVIDVTEWHWDGEDGKGVHKMG